VPHRPASTPAVAERVETIAKLIPTDPYRALCDADDLWNEIARRDRRYHMRLNVYPRHGYTEADVAAADHLYADALIANPAGTYPGLRPR